MSRFLRRCAPAFTAVLPPLSILVYWFLANFSYPRSDDAGYAETAQAIQLAFKNGVIAGLSQWYLLRDFHPVLHPSFATVFLFLLHGNILASIGIVVVLYYGILLLYVFALLKMGLSEWSAAVGTAAIGCVPWLLEYGKSFNADLNGALCMIAALYHLMRIRDLSRSWHCIAFSVWLGIGICSRPVEPLWALWLPILLILLRAMKAKIVAWRDLSAMIVTSLPFFCILAWTIRDLRTNNDLARQSTHIYVWLLMMWAPALLLVYFRKRLKLSSWLMDCAFPCILIVSGWYMPVTETFFGWIYMTNFGEMAQKTGAAHKTLMGYVDFLVQAVGRIWGYPVLLLVGIGLVAFSLKSLRQHRLLVVVGLITAFFPVLLGSTSYNWNMRYYLGVGVIALILATAFALRPGGMLYRARVLLVSSLAVLYAAIGWASILAPQRVPPEVRRSFPTYLWDVPMMVAVEDPGVDIFKKLDKILPRDRPINIDTISFWGSGDDLGKTIDPWMLTVVSKERGRPWTFDRMYTYFDHLDTPLKQLNQNNDRYDYAIVGPLGHQRNEADGITILAEFIQNAYQSGKLEKLGLRKLGLIEGVGRDGAHGEFLVVQPARTDNAH